MFLSIFKFSELICFWRLFLTFDNAIWLHTEVCISQVLGFVPRDQASSVSRDACTCLMVGGGSAVAWVLVLTTTWACGTLASSVTALSISLFIWKLGWSYPPPRVDVRSDCMIYPECTSLQYPDDEDTLSGWAFSEILLGIQLTRSIMHVGFR